MNVIVPGDFALLAEQAGLTLTLAQANDLREGYGLVRAMAELVRGSREQETEPAHIFTFDRGRLR
jgi:hypothetical protein